MSRPIWLQRRERAFRTATAKPFYGLVWMQVVTLDGQMKHMYFDPDWVRGELGRLLPDEKDLVSLWHKFGPIFGDGPGEYDKRVVRESAALGRKVFSV